MIERLKLGTAVHIQGIAALASQDNQEFAHELVSRVNLTLEKLKGDLMDQVVVDTSKLPERVNGESLPSTATLVGSDDLDWSVVEALLLG